MDSSTAKQMKVIVRGQDGKELIFRIKPEVQLAKLLMTYCEKKELDFAAVRFFYNDKRINKNHTPVQLGMQDGDQIEAMIQMKGGGHQ